MFHGETEEWNFYQCTSGVNKSTYKKELVMGTVWGKIGVLGRVSFGADIFANLEHWKLT